MNCFAWLCGLPGVFRGVDASSLNADPIQQFDRWFRTAKRARLYQPNALQLATTSAAGRPAVRTVLLKSFDHRGFVFYSNYESRKGGELAENPQAMMLFFWNELHRQVRIEGHVERVSEEQSAHYFHSRPRGSQIGAWASHQSRAIDSRQELEERVQQYERDYHGREIPLPPYWGGYRLVPDAMEFWQGRAFRLHDRFIYRRAAAGWIIGRLSP